MRLMTPARPSRPETLALSRASSQIEASPFYPSATWMWGGDGGGGGANAGVIVVVQLATIAAAGSGSFSSSLASAGVGIGGLSFFLHPFVFLSDLIP